MGNTADEIFGILILSNKNTKYKVNAEKMSELTKLTTATQLIITKAATSRALNPCRTCTNVITKHHRKLLDMQCLLVQVLTVKHMLNRDAVTIKEIFDYCKEHYVPALSEIKKLIIIAIANGYLVESST